MAKVFFSYSHRDEADRDELEAHLKPMKRDGVISSWHDRQIDAGDDVHGSISEHLETADIVLLLVSPHFLASDYCHDVEMRRALERHAAKDARVIPVILDHCDWLNTSLSHLMAVPRDGKPIRKFPNRNEAFLEVAQAIRKAVGGARDGHQPGRSAETASPVRGPIRQEVRSSNLAVRKAFTDHERDLFLEEAFEYLAKFFDGSLKELERRSRGITTRFRQVDSTRFSAFIYRDGECVAQCGVRLGESLGKGITYASDPNAANSWNEHLSVCDNGTSLMLKSMGMGAFGSQQGCELTFEGAAEAYWAMLIRPLQR